MPQHSDDEVLARRASVARLYLQGLRQSDIAHRVSVTQQQVSLDLAEIRKDWQTSTLVDFNEAKSQELAKIDNLEATLWQAWFDSMRPLKKKSSKMRGDIKENQSEEEKKKQKPKFMETTEHTEERLGDPRYLLGVDRCIERRCRILGLDAPTKVAIGDWDISMDLSGKRGA